jgi:hypothetical protein
MLHANSHSEVLIENLDMTTRNYTVINNHTSRYATTISPRSRHELAQYGDDHYLHKE